MTAIPLALIGAVWSLLVTGKHHSTAAFLERLSPLAMVAIGGLMVSTFLTLLYVPIFYTLFEDTVLFAKRLVGKRRPAETPLEEAR